MNIMEQTEQQLKEEIQTAVIKAGLAKIEEIPTVVLETPKDTLHGDYATNMAMQLTRIAKKSPRTIAEQLINHFDKTKAFIAKIEIAGPGFINFYMDNSYLTNLIPTVLQAGESYGKTNIGTGQKVLVEFVSANPTGSLHLGHARGAAYGDSLCNILFAAGYDVSREYYINDAGNQINNLTKSVESRYFQALGLTKEMPEDGYFGQDIIELGKQIAKENADSFVQIDEQVRLKQLRSLGLKFELEKLKTDLDAFRVAFDVWFSESTLYDGEKIENVLAMLRENGHIYESEGATWFQATTFGDEKDRVLIKQDNSYTYIVPDIAYHQDKLNRGFEKLINVWGADHHGYIPRMKAAIQALGYDKDTLEVEIIQLVRLIKNGEVVKMSKRTGKAITMRDLIEEIGLDAVRYFFVMRSSDTHLDFDMDLAVSQSNENPVYYAQYAHARVCSILRQAEENFDHPDFSHIQSEKEIELLKKIGEFPNTVSEAALKRAPHRITSYIFELASTLHSFYNAEKVLDSDNVEKSRARLSLMKAVQITLKNALTLISVSAPEKM